MNIKELYTLDDHEAGAEFQLVNKRGKPVDMHITIVGLDSRLWRKLQHELRMKSFKGEGDPEDNRAEALAGASLSWRGIESNGKELEFSKESVKQLFINSPINMERADSFLSDRENFMKSKDAN